MEEIKEQIVEDNIKDINKELKEINLRFEKNEESIEALFAKTDYQNVQYIKFMNENIQQNTSKIQEFQEIADRLRPLYEHFETNVYKAIQSEIYPDILKNIESKFVRLFVNYDEFQAMSNKNQSQNRINQEKIASNFNTLTQELNDQNMKLSQFTNDYVSNITLRAELTHYCSMGLYQKTQREMLNLMSINDFNEKMGDLEYKLAKTQRIIKNDIYTIPEVQKYLVILKQELITVTNSLVPLDKFNTFKSSQQKKQEKIDETFNKLKEVNILQSNQVKINENEIKRLRNEKTDNETVNLLKQELKERYCLYDDLKELYEIVNPPIDRFTKLVGQFTKDNENAKEIIRNFDESIATKANKTEIYEIRMVIETLTKVSETKQLEKQLSEKIKEVYEQFKTVDKSLNSIEDSMSQDIFQAVKKANAIIQQGQEKLQLKMRRQQLIDQQNLKKAGKISLKPASEDVLLPYNSVCPQDIKDLYDIKANKVDLEQFTRLQDVQQRQISQILVLLIELSKTLIKTFKSDENQIQASRLHVLQQAMLVMKWVDDLQIENISLTQTKLPEDLLQLNEHSKQLIKDFPNQNQKHFYETINSINQRSKGELFHSQKMDNFMKSTLADKKLVSLPKFRLTQRDNSSTQFEQQKSSTDYFSINVSKPVSRATLSKRAKSNISVVDENENNTKREKSILKENRNFTKNHFMKSNSSVTFQEQRFLANEVETLHEGSPISTVQFPNI